MNEKNFQTLFTKWLKRQGRTGAYELKICKKPSLPFSNVEEHQINALKEVKDGTFAYKISDFSPGMKPFDCFCMSNESAYVAIMFYYPNKSKNAYVIDIDIFISLIKTCGRKSITDEMAKSVGEMIIF